VTTPVSLSEKLCFSPKHIVRAKILAKFL
jgi:hypothetical protein